MVIFVEISAVKNIYFEIFHFLARNVLPRISKTRDISRKNITRGRGVLLGSKKVKV